MCVCVADNCKHKKSEHMEKYGRRFNAEGRHGYTNVIPIMRRSDVLRELTKKAFLNSLVVKDSV